MPQCIPEGKHRGVPAAAAGADWRAGCCPRGRCRQRPAPRPATPPTTARCIWAPGFPPSALCSRGTPGTADPPPALCPPHRTPAQNPNPLRVAEENVVQALMPGTAHPAVAACSTACAPTLLRLLPGSHNPEGNLDSQLCHIGRLRNTLLSPGYHNMGAHMGARISA